MPDATMSAVSAGPGSDGPEARFRALFDATYDDLVRFVARRTGETDAADVVAEAFLTAWRRFADVPAETGDARAWLFVTARYLLANRARRDRGRAVVAVRLAGAVGEAAHADEAAAARLDMARAFARLSVSDQEVLALTAWDGLSQAEAAAVLGVSAGAYAVRLSRARRRLRGHLGGDGAATAERSGW